MLEAVRGQTRQLCCQFDGGLIGRVSEGTRVGESSQLFGCGLNDRFLAVADGDAPEARESVQEFMAVDICHVGALAGAEYDGAALFVGGQWRHRMKGMREVFLR